MHVFFWFMLICEISKNEAEKHFRDANLFGILNGVPWHVSVLFSFDFTSKSLTHAASNAFSVNAQLGQQGCFWECGRKPVNPDVHREIMRTPSRKVTGWDSKPGLFCAKQLR